MYKTLLDIAVSTLKYKYLKTRIPLVLSISITSRCNLRCIYCYSEEDNKHPKDVPATEIYEIIDEFYSMGTRVVMLQGGEPLLHKEVDDIIKYVKSKNMYCAITTNSINFEKHMNALKKVNQVQLSIDGNREITDKNRGKGVYDSIVEAARLCDENRIPFHFHIVLTRDTTVQNTLEPLTELANRFRTYINFCIPASTGSARDRHLASNEQIHRLYKMINELKKAGMPTNNSYHGIKDIIKWTASNTYDSFIASDDNSRKPNYQKCIMGNLVCWLDAAGMLHPCAIKFGQRGFAYSIREYGVKGAWKKLKHLPCHYCANSTEFNNLFNFRMESVVNSLKFLFRRH